MTKFVATSVLLASAIVIGFVPRTSATANQDSEKLTPAKLNEMVVGLGYEPKALNTEEGKEKWEVKLTKGGLDVPIGYELSPSKNYIWLTVFVGASSPSTKFEELLKKNGEIQPVNFYITAKGNLMLGLAIDNRNVTPATMRRCLDLISQDTADTEAIWKK